MQLAPRVRVFSLENGSVSLSRKRESRCGVPRAKVLSLSLLLRIVLDLRVCGAQLALTASSDQAVSQAQLASGRALFGVCVRFPQPAIT